MTGGSWPEFLGRLGATGLLYSIHRICRPSRGRHVLRARSVKAAHPDGPAPARATGAEPLITFGDIPEWRRRGLPDAAGREPGACLPSIDPQILARMRARLGGCEDGRHYFVKQDGQWVCTLPSCGATR